MGYGALIELENPELTTPFIFAWSTNGTVDSGLNKYFNERNVYLYDPTKPGVFHKVTLPPQHRSK